MPKAKDLTDAMKKAAAEPERFELGSANWVTTRLSAEKPMPKKLWAAWLKDSYASVAGKKR